MFQLLGGVFITNKNWWNSMVQRNGMVDKDCSVFGRVITLIIKEWTKIYSLFDFCTVGLGLCLE